MHKSWRQFGCDCRTTAVGLACSPNARSGWRCGSSCLPCGLGSSHGGGGSWCTGIFFDSLFVCVFVFGFSVVVRWSWIWHLAFWFGVLGFGGLGVGKRVWQERQTYRQESWWGETLTAESVCAHGRPNKMRQSPSTEKQEQKKKKKKKRKTKTKNHKTFVNEQTNSEPNKK